MPIETMMAKFFYICVCIIYINVYIHMHSSDHPFFKSGEITFVKSGEPETFQKEGRGVPER